MAFSFKFFILTICFAFVYGVLLQVELQVKADIDP